MFAIARSTARLIVWERSVLVGSERGIKRMLARMDDLEKKQMELHERQHRILKKIDPGA